MDEHNDEVAGLLHLKRLALYRMSVHCPGLPAWRKPRAAAFVLFLQGAEIAKMLESGLFVYIPKAKRGNNEA